MAEFKLRRSKLRGKVPSRLRGEPAVAQVGTVYPGHATAGEIATPLRVTTMFPATPRIRMSVISSKVTTPAQAAILKRGPATASGGNARPPSVAPEPTHGTTGATGTAKTSRPAVVLAPPKKTVTGETPDTGTPEATGVPKVPVKVKGTTKKKGPGLSPGRSH